MSLEYRLAFFGCLVLGLATVAIPADSAAGSPAAAQLSAEPAHPDKQFSEVERRAAAQEGLSERDKAFLMTAAQSQMLQLEVSRVAIHRAKNPQTRRFAEDTVKFVVMAKDHLDAIANEFGMSLPKTLPDQVQNAHQALDKAADPDREYVLGIISDLSNVSTLYRDESRNGKNPVLARYAQEALPRLRQHYRSAENLLDTRR